MYKIKTYNKISKIGLEAFDDKYTGRRRGGKCRRCYCALCRAA